MLTAIYVKDDESVTMNEEVYKESVANSLLPDNYSYYFERIDLVSEMDENGEVKIDIIGRTDVRDVSRLTTFLSDFYSSSGSTFNVKSGRADRSGGDCHIRGYRKCMMQVCQTNVHNPKGKAFNRAVMQK